MINEYPGKSCYPVNITKGTRVTIAHGGNVYEVASQLGCSPEDILDFSASINPLGPPPGLLEEFNRYHHRLQHYPDIRNRDLLKSLARFHALSTDQIVVGNGSTELLYWLPKALGIRKAVVVLPTFSEYAKAFELQGVWLGKLFTFPHKEYQPAVEQLDAICNSFGPEAILVTHPGSPAGTLLPHDVRTWLLEKSRDKGIFCIVDEVFTDFCEEESFKSSLEENPHLMILRSMTKFYAIPGLRLGYLLASESIATGLRSCLPPWSVNTLSQIAGSFCLSQEEYRRKTLDLIHREREKLSKTLGAIQGWTVFPGKANYLLVSLDESLPSARVLQQDILTSHRILIRDCSSFEGMGEHTLRLAIRLPEENERLSDALTLWARSHGL